MIPDSEVETTDFDTTRGTTGSIVMAWEEATDKNTKHKKELERRAPPMFENRLQGAIIYGRQSNTHTHTTIPLYRCIWNVDQCRYVVLYNYRKQDVNLKPFPESYFLFLCLTLTLALTPFLSASP